MAEEDLEQTPPPETPVETPPAAGKESIYILKERYTIDFSSPMVWLDTNGAKAYKVEDKSMTNANFSPSSAITSLLREALCSLTSNQSTTSLS